MNTTALNHEIVKKTTVAAYICRMERKLGEPAVHKSLGWDKATLFCVFFYFYFIKITTAQVDTVSLLRTVTVKVDSLFQHQKYDSITTFFNETMHSKLPASQLESVWEGIPQLYGEFLKFDTIEYRKLDGYWGSRTLSSFKRGKLWLLLYFDSNLQITGLFLRPSADNDGGYEPPKYVDNSKFYETKTEVVTGSFKMPGILTIPNDGLPHAAFILVQGSGANDKNEQLFSHRPFQDLAWGLAAKGFVVLRYDKRTYIYGEGGIGEPGKITIRDEYLDDVKSAVALLKTKAYINPKEIVVLGHSQGAMILPLIAQDNKDLAGFIHLAGPARKLQDIIPDQMAYLSKGYENDSETMQDVGKALAQVKLGDSDTLKLNTPGDMLPLGFPGSYWLNFRRYDPLKANVKLKKPILYLQGQRDYQVTMKNWEMLLSKVKNKKASFKLYPKLNHLFAEGNGPSMPAEYTEPGNIPEYVINDIAAWLGGVLRGGR